MSSLSDQSAFPVNLPSGNSPGMTYRQWLVGMALQGLLANENAWEQSNKNVADFAIQAADETIKQLESQPK